MTKAYNFRFKKLENFIVKLITQSSSHYSIHPKYIHQNYTKYTIWSII